MIFFIFLVSAFAGTYGLVTSFRPKTPLFYKIVAYGFGSYFMGVFYNLLYVKLVSGGSGFHVGYLGYVGTFFFLFSSYFGALDRLADGHEKKFRPYRFAALLPAAFIIGAGIYKFGQGGNLFRYLLLLPTAGTAYFSCKHLILPDVEMGIIRVMRPYNAIITVWCMVQPFMLGMTSETSYAWFLTVLNGVLIILALPVARKGVGKWFI